MVIVIQYEVVIRCDKNRVEYVMYKLSHVCIYTLNYILSNDFGVRPILYCVYTKPIGGIIARHGPSLLC